MVYHVGFLRWKVARPSGKLACGLRVVPVDQGRFAGPLSWNAIGIRAGDLGHPQCRVRIAGARLALSLFNLVDAAVPALAAQAAGHPRPGGKTQVVRIR